MLLFCLSNISLLKNCASSTTSKLRSLILHFNVSKIFFLSFFEELAIGVLDVYDTNTDDRENIHIILDKNAFYDMTPLDMAQIGDCKNFIAHPAVQSVLTTIWVGHTAYKAGFMDQIKV